MARILVLVLILGAFTARAAACDTAQPTPPEQPAAVVKLPAKQLKFGMNSQKWENVFAWLARETGMPVVANSYPTGSYSFQGPPDKLYSLDEIVDLLNVGLLSNPESQKYLLLVGEKSFTLVGADEKIDSATIRDVALDDLPRQQRITDLVRVGWTIKKLVALDLANDLKNLVGPFARIDVLHRSNQIHITDTVANLRRLARIIADADCGGNKNVDTYAHTCKNRALREVEQLLIAVLGDPKILFPTGKVPPGVQPFSIALDARTGQVVVTGPADKVRQASTLLKQIDQPGYSDSGENFSFKRIDVPTGNAEVIAKTAASFFNGSSANIQPVGLTQILVYASPADHVRINMLVTWLRVRLWWR